MIRVSDYIVRFLENHKINHIFMFAGGMSMHINDSVGYSNKIKPVFMLHEQGCTFAAESYARITNNLGVVSVTCGPGATNTLTGIACSWVESTPLLILTGQCKREDISTDPDLRQFGVQEVRITEIVKPITKYTSQILEPEMIRYELEKAIYICRNGRPGPVLLDIPVDVQGSYVDENILPAFTPDNKQHEISQIQIEEVVKLLNSAKRPVLYVGAGIIISNARDEFRRLIEKIKIPVLVHWNAIDLLETEHPLYAGRPGAVGQRAANFTLQNADLLITIGTRLSLLQTGYNFKEYARNAKLIMVDVDEAEMRKKNVNPYLRIHADAKNFINQLLNHPSLNTRDHLKWLHQTKEWMNKYPPLKKEWKHTSGYINSFYLVNCISKQMSPEDIFIGGRAGTCVDATIQTLEVKRNQRAFITKGMSSMGYGLPAAIGGYYATGKRVICIVGDGGFIMNTQELEIIRRENLPIKIFVLNNSGYATIRNTQAGVFEGHYVGCNKESGLTIGNINKIAEAYDIRTYTINSSEGITKILSSILSSNEPCIVNAVVALDQPIEPRQASYRLPNGQLASRPLEDMKPLLDREEIKKIMSNN